MSCFWFLFIVVGKRVKNIFLVIVFRRIYSFGKITNLLSKLKGTPSNRNRDN